MNLPHRFRLVVQSTVLAFSATVIPLLLAQASTQQPPTQQSAQQQPAPMQGPITLIGRYRGLLPCADCSGVDTELALYAKSAHEFVNTRYVMKLTYQKGKGPAKTLAESGTWTLLRGTPDDPNATVYQLTNTKTGQLTNFLKLGNNQLQALDKDQHRIETAIPHTLSRVLPSQNK